MLCLLSKCLLLGFCGDLRSQGFSLGVQVACLMCLAEIPIFFLSVVVVPLLSRWSLDSLVISSLSLSLGVGCSPFRQINKYIYATYASAEQHRHELYFGLSYQQFLNGLKGVNTKFLHLGLAFRTVVPAYLSTIIY